MTKIISNIPKNNDGEFWAKGDTVDTIGQAHTLWQTLGKDILYYLDNYSLMVNKFDEPVGVEDLLEGYNLPFTFKSFREVNIPLCVTDYGLVLANNSVPTNNDDVFDCVNTISQLQQQVSDLRLLVIKNLKQDKDQAKYIEKLDTIFIHSDKLRRSVGLIINMLDAWDALSSWVEVFKQARGKQRGLK